MQKPESMDLIPPENNGNYVYLMVFSDGNRIDLTVACTNCIDEGEPESMWKAAFETLYLFGDVAREVAAKLEFTYDEQEEKGIETYMKQVRDGLLKY